MLAVAFALLSRTTPSAQGGDATPPTVTAQSPAPGAEGVSTAVDVSATFSEPIQPATLVMQLRDSNNVLRSSQVSYDPDTKTATLDPDSDLEGGQTFTVTVSEVQDLDGNQMTELSWSFTTATLGFQDVLLPQTGLVNPTVIQFASDGRLFVAEKSGRLFFYDNLDDSTPTLFADLTTNVHNYWDRGMLGMALHPAFPAIPYIYVLYTFDAVLPGFPPPRWGTVGAASDGCSNGATDDGCVVTGRLSRLNLNDFSGTPLTTENESVLVEDWWQQFPSHSLGSLGFGADGALYASGGEGANWNYVDSGPPASPVGDPPAGDPASEGGALRSQDLRTGGDAVGLNGAVIRIDPDTGAALPDNPLFASGDANAQRIVAYGFRNPFRFTIKPGTNELWIGDPGWAAWEEINRVPDPLSLLVRNFGWPCYEGDEPSSYEAASLPICADLYAESPAQSGLTGPYFAYINDQPVVADEACPVGSSSISGLAFYPESGGTYPSAYNGALFFADYSRDCIWAMRLGANGLPDPTDIVTIKSNPGDPREGPVQLVSGPDGDIYFPGYDDNRLHRIRFTSGNQPPTAVIQADPSFGPSPLTVSFTAAASSDPEGQPLTFAWDLNGDSAFDDASVVAPQFTYSSSTPLAVTVRVRATDGEGLSDEASIVISVNDTPPTPVIATPSGTLTWNVGDAIDFSGSATDPEDGTLAPASLLWSLIMHHCPSSCHEHTITDFVGVAGGSFVAPDHEYPSALELRLIATDSGGLQNSASVVLQPRTVSLTFQTSPPGLQLAVNSSVAATPFTRTVIVGSSNSISAPPQQFLGAPTYRFVSWLHGGNATHNIAAPEAATTYTANYSLVGSAGGVAQDLDGDRKADIAVYRSSTGEWLVLRSADGGLTHTTWGCPSCLDSPVAADFDGDAKSDVAVYRFPAGGWFINRSGGGGLFQTSLGCPSCADIPVPADYDGDGLDDVAVYRLTSGTWLINRPGGGPLQQEWGCTSCGDLPAPADYDGDKKADLAVYRFPTGEWFVNQSGGGGLRHEAWGCAPCDDVPVAADYDGDGNADVAIYRFSTGEWFINRSGGGGLHYVSWGCPSCDDVPVAADYDGDGEADIAVYRLSTGEWFVLRSGDSTLWHLQWGAPSLGDLPLELSPYLFYLFALGQKPAQ
ncbi:MAG TPA: PQQ-dependent sugar dehydrogenase [Vicinamibacterales bacterium]|nr:PQQ-dependent sugar dehydrogenase [Vicinamibacterales bacterium]